MFGGVRGYPDVTGGPVGPGGPWRKVLCVEKFCRTARNMSHSGRNGGVRCVWRDWRVPVRAKRVVRRRMRDEKEASWDDVGRWQHPRSRQAEGAERGVLSLILYFDNVYNLTKYNTQTLTKLHFLPQTAR